MAKRAKSGDILEVKTPDGLAYLQYVGKHPDLGDTILVSPTTYQKRPADFDQTFENGYVTFYPVNAAISKNMVEVVGRKDVPAGLPPKRLRLEGVWSDRGVETWVIEGESGQTVKKTLSEEERRLPIGSIWNHEFLLQRLATGWRPEMEG